MTRTTLRQKSFSDTVTDGTTETLSGTLPIEYGRARYYTLFVGDTIADVQATTISLRINGKTILQDMPALAFRMGTDPKFGMFPIFEEPGSAFELVAIHNDSSLAPLIFGITFYF